MKQEIPELVRGMALALEAHGYEAYLVGGSLRDMIIGRTPKDWDLATSATPEEIQALFPDSVYENTFGTVGVKTESEDATLKIVEITTFRIEGGYADHRHPDTIQFGKTIEEDLARRDFTVNAMALRIGKETQALIDPYGGMEDIGKNMIRAVGEPEKRFDEDALRLMRAVRLGTELSFEIEAKTKTAIQKKSALLGAIAKERIRDEFTKLIETPNAAEGILLLEETGLLEQVMPEIREGIGVGQNKHHIYTIFEHNLKALEYAAKQNYSLIVRLASFLHDVGKPRTKKGDGPDSSFHAHEMVGGKMARDILRRLCYSNDIVDRVSHLVRHHMFYYNVGDVTDAGVRRFLARVGIEHLDDLLKVREGDRIGSGVPKAVPYKTRHLMFMIEKVRKDPLEPKMLALRGDELMRLLQIPPSRRVGDILKILLDAVLEDPEKNKKEWLAQRAEELNSYDEKTLRTMAEEAHERVEGKEEEIESDIKKKYYVE
jgi:poly(A) polymerase/tRNA nucleotidyltransferase (CCA-adding enzyme)